MSGPSEQKNLVRQWTEKAEQDLLAAQRLLEAKDGNLNDAVCFHAQQSAEKYLKALLVNLDIEVPYTHDLRLLLELAGPKSRLDLATLPVFGLNRYAIQARYPGDWEPIERPEAEEAVAAARAVRKAVIERLKG